ncbi:rab-protein geranylgeranyltransferase [Gymnopilus junonius]|uniref:Geranylgeranyl transferase type-2 subunit alpha n=1 Tax=Gymnopilus junonius TaxID=109634 RepID=A0A9P5NTD3_GYMJU|nr:rab-protein geranylgeranyltransferase [Gymnopilus junonius]
MHGIKRARLTEEEREARRRRELSKIDEFTKLSDATLARKKERDWSRDAFDLTTLLLQINPEFYTIWNYRRLILLNGLFVNVPAELVKDILLDELGMTMSALKAHPKVYWIWNHRRWCLEQIPYGPGQESESHYAGWKQTAWDRELTVAEKMLDVDARNFHAWGYRRYVLDSMPNPRPESNELIYTARKIEANFSNFSAWHQRSKALASLWTQGKLDESKSREDEFELLRNAMYTDPNDQSVWIYHRWLVGTESSREILEREIVAIQELLDEQPDSKWCLESISYYKRLLLNKYTSEVDVNVLSEEIRSLLDRLETLDPARQRRYQDLRKRKRVGTDLQQKNW